jgi:hypothetical protein
VSKLLDQEIRKEKALISVLWRSIPDDELKLLEQEINASNYSVQTGCVLCAIFGSHLAYLGEHKLQIFFWFSLGGLGIWWFLEGWTLPERIALQNLKKRRILTQKYIHERLEKNSGLSTQTVVLERFQPSY